MKTKRVCTQVHTRKLDRGVVHNKMRKAGIYRINKGRRHHSFFANHWREFV